MSLLIAVPKYARLGEGFTRREQIDALEHPGRRTDGTQTAAAWLSDLIELRKLILLCTYCRPKFNPRRHRYRKFYTPALVGGVDPYMTNGRCDGCKQNTALLPGGGTAFVSEETYRSVCLDPLDARRLARAAAGAQPAWQRIQSLWGSRSPLDAAARKGARR